MSRWHGCTLTLPLKDSSGPESSRLKGDFFPPMAISIIPRGDSCDYDAIDDQLLPSLFPSDDESPSELGSSHRYLSILIVEIGVEFCRHGYDVVSTIERRRRCSHQIECWFSDCNVSLDDKWVALQIQLFDLVSTRHHSSSLSPLSLTVNYSSSLVITVTTATTVITFITRHHSSSLVITVITRHHSSSLSSLPPLSPLSLTVITFITRHHCHHCHHCHHLSSLVITRHHCHHCHHCHSLSSLSSLVITRHHCHQCHHWEHEMYK